MESTWIWIAAAVALVAVLTAVVLARSPAFERRRSAARIRRFLRDLRRVLASRTDGVRLAGVVPGRLTLVFVVDGQETPVPMQPFLQHWDEHPRQLAEVLEQLVAEIREEGLDRPGDFEFAELATDLLPQVRTMDWVQENSAAFGDGRIVHRRLGPDLAVCYVIDDAWSMVFVCEGHLRRWGRTEADVFGLARRNLAERTDGEVERRLSSGEPLVLRTGDGYAAARFLLLDSERADDLLVAMPDRDVLWIGGAADADLADLMARSADECARSTRPVSPKLYRVARGEVTEAGG